MFAYRPRKQDATFRTHGSDNWRTMEAMGNEYGFRINIDPVEGDRDRDVYSNSLVFEYVNLKVSGVFATF